MNLCRRMFRKHNEFEKLIYEEDFETTHANVSKQK